MKNYTNNHLLSISYDFLACYCEKRDLLAIVEKKLLLKSTNRATFYEKNQIVLDLFDKMRKDAEKDFAEIESDIQYYFGPPDKDSKFECIHGLLTGHTTIQAIEETSIDQHIETLQKLSTEDFFSNAFHFLCSYNNIIIKAAPSDATPDSISNLVRFILQMEIPVEVKFKLQDLLLHKEEHLKKIHKILLKVSEFVHKYQLQLDEIFNEFYKYWNMRSKDLSLKEFLEVDFKLLPAVGEGVYEYEIRPCLYPLAISLTIPDDDEFINSSKIITLSIGVLFGESLPPNSYIESYATSHDQALDAIKLLSDSSRYEILKYISNQKSYSAEIASHLGLSAATVSHHMGNLYTAGLVQTSRENKKLYYQVNKDTLANYINYFESKLLSEDFN